MARGMARTLQVVAQIAAQVAALPGPAGGGPMDGNRLAFRPFGPQVYTSAQQLTIPGRESRSPCLLPMPGSLGGVQNDRASPENRDRKSVVYGKRVSVRVDLGGRRSI